MRNGQTQRHSIGNALHSLINSAVDVRVRNGGIRNGLRNGFARQHDHVVAFSPGLLVIFLGLSVLLFPKLVLAAIAFFCVSMGVLFCFFIWKVQQLKARLDAMMGGVHGKSSNGRITILNNDHTARSDRSSRETVIVEESSKKIILH